MYKYYWKDFNEFPFNRHPAWNLWYMKCVCLELSILFAFIFWNFPIFLFDWKYFSWIREISCRAFHFIIFGKYFAGGGGMLAAVAWHYDITIVHTANINLSINNEKFNSATFPTLVSWLTSWSCSMWYPSVCGRTLSQIDVITREHLIC